MVSWTLQQRQADWYPNPLVPKVFQQLVESEVLNAIINPMAAKSQKEKALS